MARSKRARRLSALKGWETRRARTEQAQRDHGKIARERSEARLTPAQKRARTIAANKLEREIRTARRSAAAKRGWETRRRHEGSRPASKSVRSGRGGGGGSGMESGGGSPSGFASGPASPIYSLDQLDDYPDWDDGIEYDVETSPDYGD